MSALEHTNADFILWRLEESLSPAACAAVETAIRGHIERATVAPAVRAELENLANEVRAMLQHVMEDGRARTLRGHSASVQSEPSPDDWMDS